MNSSQEHRHLPLCQSKSEVYASSPPFPSNETHACTPSARPSMSARFWSQIRRRTPISFSPDSNGGSPSPRFLPADVGKLRLELDQCSKELERLRETEHSTKMEMERLRKTLEEATNRMEEAEKQLLAKTQDCEQKDSELLKCRQDNHQLLDEVRNLKTQLEKAQVAFRDAEEEARKAKAEVDELSHFKSWYKEVEAERDHALKMVVPKLEKEVKDLEYRNGQAAKRINQLETQQLDELQSCKSGREKLKLKCENLERELKAASDTNDILQNQLESTAHVKAQNTRLQQELEKHAEQIATLDELNRSLNDRKQDAQLNFEKERDCLLQQMEEYKYKLASLECNFRSLTDEKQVLTEELAAVKQIRDALDEEHQQELAKVMECEQQIQQLSTVNNIQETDNTKLSDEVLQLHAQVGRLNSELVSVCQAKDDLEENVRSLSDHNSNLFSQLLQLNEQVADMNSSIAKLVTDLNHERGNVAELFANAELLNEQLAAKDEAYASVSREFEKMCTDAAINFEAWTNERSELNDELRSMSNRLMEIETQRSEAVGALASLKTELETAKNEAVNMREKYHDGFAELENKTVEILDVQHRLTAELEARDAELQIKIAEMTELRLRFAAELEAREEACRQQLELQKKLDTVKAELFKQQALADEIAAEKVKEVSALENRAAVKLAENEVLQLALRESELKAEATEKELEAEKGRIAEMQKSINVLQSTLKQFEDSHADIAQKMAEGESSVALLKEQLQFQQVLHDTLQQKLEEADLARLQAQQEKDACTIAHKEEVQKLKVDLETANQANKQQSAQINELKVMVLREERKKHTLAEKKEQLREAKQALEVSYQERDQLLEQLDKSKKDCASLSEELVNSKNEIGTLKRKLRTHVVAGLPVLEPNFNFDRDFHCDDENDVMVCTDLDHNSIAAQFKQPLPPPLFDRSALNSASSKAWRRASMQSMKDSDEFVWTPSANYSFFNPLLRDRSVSYDSPLNKAHEQSFGSELDFAARLQEISRRNTLVPPHLKTVNPIETQVLPAEVSEQGLRCQPNYQIPASIEKKLSNYNEVGAAASTGRRKSPEATSKAARTPGSKQRFKSPISMSKFRQFGQKIRRNSSLHTPNKKAKENAISETPVSSKKDSEWFEVSFQDSAKKKATDTLREEKLKLLSQHRKPSAKTIGPLTTKNANINN